MSFPGVPIQHVTEVERDALRSIAARALRAHVRGEPAPRIDRMTQPQSLWRPGASFVTLRRGGDLRGCIGSLEPRRPLAVDVAANTVAAASTDPRFTPVGPDELDHLDIKISVLTPPQALAVGSLDELRAAIEPGRDGLVIEAPGQRATFLPAVWEQLTDVEEFLDQLWRKADLTPGTWPAGLTVARYRSEEF